MTTTNIENEIAFIIGNGISRKSFDLNTLVGKGTIFGCNALHRNFDKYDYLIAIDDGMIKEISDDPKAIIPPQDERYESARYNRFQRRRSNAGMNAMLESIRRGAKFVYCFGFDFLLYGSISTDNVYKNTNNYGPETHAIASDNYYRIQYLEWFVRDNPDVTFIFVFPDNVQTKNVEASNCIRMDYNTFINKLDS